MEDKRRLETLFILVVAVAIVLPVLWGEPRQVEGQSGGDPWRNIIFDFQTLITGCLALWAAKMTVSQMRRSDELQEQRHKETQQNSRNRLIAAAIYYPPLLNEAGASLTLLNRKATQQSPDLNVVGFITKMTYSKIQEILTEPEFERAKEMFEPSLRIACSQALRIVSENYFMGREDGAYSQDDVDIFYSADGIAQEAEQLRFLVSAISQMLKNQALPTK